MSKQKPPSEVENLLSQARKLAADYYKLTGKPLGIAGEIGEFEAARLLELKLADAREAGFDATDAKGRRLQIKARCVANPKQLGGQRLGSINLMKSWDAAIVVVMTRDFEPVALYEAARKKIEEALLVPGSKARNERGALTISKFKSIGKQVWPTSE